MAKTVRRKHYTPRWVIEDWAVRVDRYTGNEFSSGLVLLEGKAKKKQLRWWHEDKSSWWNVCPSRSFRSFVESQHRVQCREELAKYVKNYDHEVMILDIPKLPYWD